MNSRDRRSRAWLPIAILSAGLLLGTSLVIFSLFRKWTIAEPQGELARFLDWVLYGGGQEAALGVVSDLGTGLISAAMFLVVVQLILEKHRTERNDSRRAESELTLLLERLRLGGNATTVAIADLRASGALLSGELTGAFLAHLELLDLDLSGAQFAGADFAESDLSGSSLIGANLQGARLDTTTLDGVNLSFANLKDAKLSPAGLQAASSLWRCTLPNGQLYDGAWELSGDIESASKLGIDLLEDTQRRKFYLGE